MNARTKKITVRLTADEAAAIKTKAAEMGLTENDYVVGKALAAVTVDAGVREVSERMDALEGALASALEAHSEAIADTMKDDREEISAALTRQAEQVKRLLETALKRMHTRGAVADAATIAETEQTTTEVRHG